LLEKTLPRIDKDFSPSEEDIFSSRKKTTGITSIQFKHSNIVYHYFVSLKKKFKFKLKKGCWRSKK